MIALQEEIKCPVCLRLPRKSPVYQVWVPHIIKHHSVWLKLESLSFPAVYVRPHPVQGVPPAMRGLLPHLQAAAQRQDQVHRRRQSEQFTEQDLNSSFSISVTRSDVVFPAFRNRIFIIFQKLLIPIPILIPVKNVITMTVIGVL